MVLTVIRIVARAAGAAEQRSEEVRVPVIGDILGQEVIVRQLGQVTVTIELAETENEHNPRTREGLLLVAESVAICLPAALAAAVLQ